MLETLSCPATIASSPMVPSVGQPAPPASLLLVVSAQSTNLTDGHWHFVIESAAGGAPLLEAEDDEFGDLNRLTLLAAVRGFESIDGPSDVTLLSHNRYLIRSLTDSLPRWRRNDFVWDHFGRRVEVQHADLWRRIDRALLIHQVQACLLTTRRISQPLPPREDEATRSASGMSAASSGSFVRIDDPHAGPTRSHSFRRPGPAGSPVASTSPDRLRDWLLRGSVAAAPGRGGELPRLPPARSRFTLDD